MESPRWSKQAHCLPTSTEQSHTTASIHLVARQAQPYLMQRQVKSWEFIRTAVAPHSAEQTLAWQSEQSGSFPAFFSQAVKRNQRAINCAERQDHECYIHGRSGFC